MSTRPCKSEMIDGAAPVASQHAGGMRIVHHHDGAVPLGRFDQSGQRPDVAIHRKHAIGDQQLAPWLTVKFCQYGSRGGGILMRKTWILAFDRRQPSMMLA